MTSATSVPTRITFKKGPLGYAVLVDGQPIGSIRSYRQHRKHQVHVPGFNPGVAGLAGMGKEACCFPTIAQARAAVLRHLTTTTSTPAT